jgi:hypothetical protein
LEKVEAFLSCGGAREVMKNRGRISMGNDGTCRRTFSSSDDFRAKTTEMETVRLQVP